MSLEDRIVQAVTALVIVGPGRFFPALFNEHMLFDGRLDKEKTIVPEASYGQYSYCSKQYEFMVQPNNLTLRCPNAEPPGLITPELVAAFSLVSDTLDPLRKAVVVSAVGVNSDLVLSKHQRSGAEFCSALTDSSEILDPVDEGTMHQSYLRFRRINAGGTTFDVRIEPHIESNGEKLFIGVNASQTISSEELIKSKLNLLDEYHAQLDRILRNICSIF